MTLITQNQNLSKDGLTVSFVDSAGRPLDPQSVTYTVYNSVGAPVSGLGLPAISQGNGIFYASWQPSVPNGAYVVVWRSNAGVEIRQNVFVVDKSSYVCSNQTAYKIPLNAIPPAGSRTYLAGYQLTPTDIQIQFRDSSTNILTDPYSVYYTIFNSSGCAVTTTAAATKLSVGIYWVNWRVIGFSGDYRAIFEYLDTSNSPTATKTYYFSIICARNPEPQTNKCGCALLTCCC